MKEESLEVIVPEAVGILTNITEKKSVLHSNALTV